MQTQSTDGTNHASQPLPTVINIPSMDVRAAHLGPRRDRVSNPGLSRHPDEVVGLNARLLRDMAGNNMAYNTNSITLAGG